MNEIKLKGRIVGLQIQTKFSALTLITSSQAGFKSLPHIYVLDKDLKAEFDKSFKIGDMVTIRARVQTSKNRPTHIVAYAIEPTKRVFEEAFGVKKGMYEDDLNEVKLQGTLTHVFIPPVSKATMALATIRTIDENGRTNYPVVTLFGQDANTVKTIPLETDICFLGRIQTHRSEKEGKSRYFESIVGTIAKA